VVGLVKHGDLDRIEVHEALLHEVFETTGAGHNNVNAGPEGGNLTVLAHTTKNRGGGESIGGSEWLDDGGDLSSQFTGRREHETQRTAWAALSAGKFSAEARNHGQREGESLARASFSATEYVATFECVRQGVELDGEWRGFAVRCEYCDERGWYAE
jgi:hypothetical protein